jgi:hypothetical protein
LPLKRRIATALAAVLLVATASNAEGAKNATGIHWNGRSLAQDTRSAVALRTIADDATSSREARARAIFSLFATYLRPPLGGRAVAALLAPARWLGESRLEGVYSLGGWIPVEMGLDSTAFCLRLFPDHRGRSEWVIYFRLSGGKDQSAEAAQAFLQKGVGVGAALMEFALCFPPVGKQRMGRIERFTAQGIAVVPGS